MLRIRSLMVALTFELFACSSSTVPSAGTGDMASGTTGGTAAGGHASGGGAGAPPSGGTGGTASGGGGIGALGGTAGAASGGTASGGAGPSDSFQVSTHLASEEDPKAPTTVGIVEWSTNLGMPTAAAIQFGLDEAYGMEAPVDITQSMLRAVLLGMKPDRVYHFRVSAAIDGEIHLSADRTIQTGPGPAYPLVSGHQALGATQSAPGFVITSNWNQEAGGLAFIFDSDGDVVWWYDPGLVDGVARAAISADCRDLWMVSPNIRGGEPLVRVGLDGLGPQNYPETSGSHDIIPVSQDVMAFIEYGGSTTGIGVSEIDRAGKLTKILRHADLPPPAPEAPGGVHHLNALAYDEAHSTYLLSSLFDDVYFFPRAGGTSENVSGLTGILGPNTGWGQRQHGIQPLGAEHLLLFANQGGQDPQASVVIEYDLAAGAEVWRYEDGASTGNFGNAQRLPSGNTLVTFSNSGLLREVTPTSEKVREVTSPLTLGYATWLPSLYGNCGLPK